MPGVGRLPRKELEVRRYLLLLCLVYLATIHVQGQERPAALPPVFLDHVYVVLDGQTYKDIVRSEFMQNQFASFSEKTTVLDSHPLSAAYIGGERTYIEMFEADKDPKFTRGWQASASALKTWAGPNLFFGG